MADPIQSLEANLAEASELTFLQDEVKRLTQENTQLRLWLQQAQRLLRTMQDRQTVHVKQDNIWTRAVNWLKELSESFD